MNGKNMLNKIAKAFGYDHAIVFHCGYDYYFSGYLLRCKFENDINSHNKCKMHGEKYFMFV